MAVERTLSIVKPDAVAKAATDEILRRSATGLTLWGAYRRRRNLLLKPVI